MFFPLNETIDWFDALYSGVGDEYPESAFYMTGNLEEALEKGSKIATKSEKK